MQIARSVGFLAVQVLCLIFRAVASDNDAHGVQVQELDIDADYRDFNETADPINDASTTGTLTVQHANDAAGHGAKNPAQSKVAVGVEHDIFPMFNSSRELRNDCKDFGCPGQSYRWLDMDEFSRVFVMLAMMAFILACLIILAALKMKLTPMRQMRQWGYSPALMEERGYELRLYRSRPRRNQLTRF